jgi:hypothetical protein
MEYGLAIRTFNAKQIKTLEDAQSNCLRMIYGGGPRSSTHVMCHLVGLPRMAERITILQAKFLIRAYNLPHDALLTKMIPLAARAQSSWIYFRQKNKIWNSLPHPRPDATRKEVKAAIRSHLRSQHATYLSRQGHILLSRCRPKLGVDPILWLPMTRIERSRCIRWRLGWLPGGKPRQCPNCGYVRGTTRKHLTECLRFNDRLGFDPPVEDPLSHLLNRLPCSRPRSTAKIQFWKRIWPLLCDVLDELEDIQHAGYTRRSAYADNETMGQLFLTWLEPLPPPQSTPLPSLSSLFD